MEPIFHRHVNAMCVGDKKTIFKMSPAALWEIHSFVDSLSRYCHNLQQSSILICIFLPNPLSTSKCLQYIIGADPGGGQGVWTLPGKSQEAIYFLRNTGMDPPPPSEKQLNPLGPFASWGRSVRPFVKYVDDKKNCQSPPNRIFWICA